MRCRLIKLASLLSLAAGLSLVFSLAVTNAHATGKLDRFSPEGFTLSYLAADGVICRAIVFIPKGEGPHPVIVALHGGGRTSGAIGVFRRYAGAFAPLNYAVVAPDYRAGWFGCGALEDMLGTIDFIGEHVRLDRDRIILVGESHGAYVAALTATRERVLAVIGTGGYYDIEKYLMNDLKNARNRRKRELYRLTEKELGSLTEGSEILRWRSPALNADLITAHVLLFHGRGDGEVPCRYSQDFADALLAAGKEVDYYVIKDKKHGLDIAGDETAEYLAGFLEKLDLPAPTPVHDDRE